MLVVVKVGIQTQTWPNIDRQSHDLSITPLGGAYNDVAASITPTGRADEVMLTSYYTSPVGGANNTMLT